LDVRASKREEHSAKRMRRAGRKSALHSRNCLPAAKIFASIEELEVVEKILVHRERGIWCMSYRAVFICMSLMLRV
jgi:hypothetical protein